MEVCDQNKSDEDENDGNSTTQKFSSESVGPSSDIHNDADDFELQENHSVWQYLSSELTRGYLLEHDEAKFTEKRERVYTFLNIPRELEKFIWYSFWQCTDAFLYIFTFLPLRIIIALVQLVVHPCGIFTSSRQALPPAKICDLIKGAIIIVCSVGLINVDTSMLYHIIRGQAIIKLYIFFNMLEVGDRLFSSFGQDILDSLFWTATEPRNRRREHFGVVPHLILAILYVLGHSCLVLFQAITLNVAFNSHNKALLTIMMSNNFVELKGSVFKKFEKNNLFQMSCSDVRERFHYVVLLFIVVVRNMTEFNWNLDHLWVLVPDIVVVLLAEVVVDWVKHAFITKFNEIPAEVYIEYTTSIAYDMASSKQEKACSDHSDLVARRMGFIPIPLACLLIRIITQSVKVKDMYSIAVIVLIYLCLVTFKIYNSIALLGQANQYIKIHKQQQAKVKKEKTERKHYDSGSERRAGAPLIRSRSTELRQHKKTIIRRKSLPTNPPASVTFSDLELDTTTFEQNGFDNLSDKGSDSSLTNASDVAITPLPRTSSFSKQSMLSNSSVSLNSTCGLNEEFLKNDEINCRDPERPNTPEDPFLNISKKKSETPLNEVDRYTMCSNRII